MENQPKSLPARLRELTHDLAEITLEIESYLNTTIPSFDLPVGNSKHGIYAFFDYDGEPIYAGQTREKLRIRIRRHLTNHRTDAVAMSVLDPFEVAMVEVWPLDEIFSKFDKKQIKDFLGRAEVTVIKKCIKESSLGAILNEKTPDMSLRSVKLPESFKASIIPDHIFERRSHPDIRLARRAATVADLARIISERKVSAGLRQTLLVQTRRIELLASMRLKQLGLEPNDAV